MNNNNKYLSKLNKLIKIIGPSGPKTYILIGSMVLYLYKLRLKDIITAKYRNPNDIDLYCTPEFYKTIVPKDYKEKKYTINYPKIGIVDFYLCNKKTIFKNAVNFENIVYCINLDDLLHQKNEDLMKLNKDISQLYFDINFISKLILLKFSLKNKNNLDKKTADLVQQQLQESVI